MGVFSKVRGARPSEGGSYFEPDHDWVVMVSACKVIDLRQGGNAFIVECRVLESTLDRVRPGAERSWYVDMGKDAAGSNLSHWAIVTTKALTGDDISPEEVDEAGCEEMVADSQPLAGLILGLHTYNKPTRAGDPFTRHKWSVIDDASLVEYEKKAVELKLKKASAAKKAAAAR